MYSFKPAIRPGPEHTDTASMQSTQVLAPDELPALTLYVRLSNECAGLSKILLILGRLRRLLPGPKSDSVENPLRALF
jgi:hypothetical protein